MFTSTKQWTEVFYKNGVSKDFTKFMGKDLFQSLFINKVASWGLQFCLDRTPAQVFYCEFAKFFEKVFLHCFWQMFYRISVLKNLVAFTRNICDGEPFFSKVQGQATNLIMKRHSRDVFMWIFQKFQKIVFVERL